MDEATKAKDVPGLARGLELTREEKIERYRHARFACEAAREFLRELPLEELLREIDLADTLGPMLDPTAWMKKGPAMREDRAVFAAALRFLGTWPK